MAAFILGALALLLAVYPLNAWRDAPLFPTPAGALQGLETIAPLPPESIESRISRFPAPVRLPIHRRG